MLKRLWRDEGGMIWLQAVFILMVTFAFGGLAIDGARFYMLHSDLQDIADAAALAGARELDSASGAMDRATNAAQTYFNSHSCPYSTGYPATGNCARWFDTSGSAIASIVFYKELATPTIADTDANATFIKVTTGTWGVAPTILTALGITAPQQTAATATAGSTYVACNVQPLMLCNPKETATSHPGFTATPGDIFGFTANGGTGGYSPGDFGLLDPPGQTNAGANQISVLLSLRTPNFCYVNSVSPDQGQKTGAVADGINVRFDITPNGNPPSDMDTTPDTNVIKGYTPPTNNGQGQGSGKSNGNGNNACPKANDVSGLNASAQLPLTTGYTKVGSTNVGGTFDTFSANTYWTTHHGSGTWPSGVTRYQMYQGERAGTYAFVTGTEAMGPTCKTADSTDQSRRVISAAVVNCLEQGIRGNSNATVRSTSYSEFFIIRPVGQDGVIWTEYIRTVKPNTVGSKLHQVVRLYNK